VHEFPKQGATPPWELNMDYLRDRKVLLNGPVGDHMRFGRERPEALPEAVGAVARRAA
jgi:hypothetical protein